MGRYHEEGDYCICTQNKKVEYKKIKYNNGYPQRNTGPPERIVDLARYEQPASEKVRRKKIVDTFDKPYYDKMHERLKTPYAKKMKKLCQSTVEPVLGTLINFLAMKRVNTRGIKLANKCILMAAIAYNIKKIMKFKSNKPTTAVARLS